MEPRLCLAIPFYRCSDGQRCEKNVQKTEESFAKCEGP